MHYIIDNEFKLKRLLDEAEHISSLVDRSNLKLGKKITENILNVCMKLLSGLALTYGLNVVIELCSEAKTKKQLRFTWGLLLEDILIYLKDCGYYLKDDKQYAKEQIKNSLYREFSEIESHISPLTGRKIFTLKRMSKMTKVEMMDFINKILIMCDEKEIPLRPECRYLWTNHLCKEEIEDCKTVILPDKDEAYLSYVRHSYCILTGQMNNIDVHHIRDAKYSGIGKKSPDWYTVPIIHEQHVRSGHISTEEIERKCKRVLNGLDLETFCRLCYLRWKEKR